MRREARVNPGAVLLRARAPGFALAALASAGPLAAQSARPLTSPPPHRIDQWTTAEGLPQNSINAIADAPDGALWIGTFGGLVRFDGTRFTPIERNDSAGRHADRVLALAAAPDGTLWVGTENGLLRRSGNSWTVFTAADGLARVEISALALAPDGTLWVGTGGGEVIRYREGRFEPVLPATGMAAARIAFIAAEADGAVWVNHGDATRRVEAGTPPRLRPLIPPGRGRRMLLRDRAGARWFSLRDGAARASPDGARLGPGFRTPEPSLMIEDPRGGYWVATRNDGAFYLRPEGDRFAASPYALPDGRGNYRVRALHADREGNVWIGTDADGLLRARRTLFTTLTVANGLSHDVATAVFGDRDGTIWVGTNCGGVNAIDYDRRSVRTFSPRRPGDPHGDPCNFALTQGADGTMWQGTYGGGVHRLEGPLAGKRHAVAGLPDSVVRALATDRDGTIWVGTDGGGLATIKDGRVRSVYTTADGLADNSIRVIRQARDGALWIGTFRGLSRFAGGRFTTWRAADGLSAGHVRAIHEDAGGTLWIGTYGGGLNRFRDGTFTPITTRDGLADDVVSSILEDSRGNLWMSGNLGIQRVARRDLERFADGHVARVHAVRYGTADGLRNAETNGGFQPAAWQDRAGRMWFPTVHGVAVVDPADLAPSGEAPPVTIEEAAVNGVPQSPGDGLTAGPGRVNLEIRYTGLSLSAPEHIRYRYRLEEFDEDWVEAGARREASYPRLPPGRYRFLVAAANREGVWSGAEATMTVRIRPPAWGTWWFRLFAVAWLLAAVAAFVRWRGAASRRELAAREAFSRRLIEGQEQERRRIARELHDGLGQELLVVKNRALLALRADGLAESARVQLEQIGEVVSGSLEAVRGLAHNLVPHQLDHLGLSEAVAAMVEEVAESSGIAITADIEALDGRLTGEPALALYRIVQEALNNVVRHSGAAAASVRLRQDGAAVRLVVADDGRGFRPRRGPGIGLRGMAERLRIHGGTLEVTSAPGRGTRIEAVLPAGGEAEGEPG